VQEFIRLVATTREAQDIERKRRLAWEQEQEAKQAQRQAETERTILEMRQEIQSLRAMLTRNGRMAIMPQSSPHALPLAPAQPIPQQPIESTTGLFTPHYALSPAVREQSIPRHPSTPTSPTPIIQTQSVIQATFVQGSSSKPYPPGAQPSNDLSLAHDSGQHIHIPYPTLPIQPQPQYRYQAGSIGQQQQFLLNQTSGIRPQSSSIGQSVTPSPSPQLSALHPSTDSSTSRKRKTSEAASDNDSDVDSDGSSITPAQRIRRANHHDRRCLTIQVS